MDKTCKFPKNILNRLKIFKSLFHINSKKKKSLGQRSLVFILISNVRHSCTICFLHCQWTMYNNLIWKLLTCSNFPWWNYHLESHRGWDLYRRMRYQSYGRQGSWSSSSLKLYKLKSQIRLHIHNDRTNKTCALKHIQGFSYDAEQAEWEPTERK